MSIPNLTGTLKSWDDVGCSGNLNGSVSADLAPSTYLADGRAYYIGNHSSSTSTKSHEYVGYLSTLKHWVNTSLSDLASVEALVAAGSPDYSGSDFCAVRTPSSQYLYVWGEAEPDCAIAESAAISFSIDTNQESSSVTRM